METTWKLSRVFRSINPLSAPEIYYRHFSDHENVIEIPPTLGSYDQPWRFELLSSTNDPRTGFTGDVMIDRQSGHAVILYKGMDVPFRDEGNGRMGFLRDSFTAAQAWWRGGPNWQTPLAEKVYLDTIKHPEVKSVEVVGFSLGTLHVNCMTAKYGVKGTVLSDLGITDRGIKNLFNRKAAGDVEGAVSNLKKNLTVLRMALDLIPPLFGVSEHRGRVVQLDDGDFPNLSGIFHRARTYSEKARRFAQQVQAVLAFG